MSDYIDGVIATREADAEFKYMLLSRMKTDCDYFLGFGRGSVNRLWAGSVLAQIQCMQKLYDSFATKPEWISTDCIESYKERMLNYNAV